MYQLKSQRGQVESYRVLIAVVIVLLVCLALAAIVFFSLNKMGSPLMLSPGTNVGVNTAEQPIHTSDTTADRNTDTDGDGMSDYVEKLSGTDPYTAE